MRSFTKLLPGIVCILCSVASYAISGNSINITRLFVQPVMPADVRVWATLANGISVTAQAITPANGLPSRMVVQIRQAGNLVCGNGSSSGLAYASFKSRSFTGGDIAAAFNECAILPSGSYSLCVQFFNDDGAQISAEVCQDFIVDKAVAAPTAYSPPVNITPADNSAFTAQDLKQPLRFSWTSVSPAPAGSVTYRLRIWQIKQGQTGKQAMEADRPFISKDVLNATETSVSDIMFPPCKPPLACKVIWTVQALNPEGQPIGSNNGTSAPFMIAAPQYIIQIDSMKVNCTATPGVYTFSYFIKNVNTGTAKLTNFVVTSSTPAGATISSFTPPLGTTIVSGAQLVVTGTISASPSLSNICIGAEITDVVNTFWQASRDTCIDVVPCRCDACDDKKVVINIPVPTSGITINANNTISLNQPITVTTTPAKLIKTIKAELVYFEFLPESEECMPCNKDAKTYGNQASGTLASITGLYAGTHSLVWNFIPPISFASTQTASVVVTIPPVVKCCSATIKWCIRYVITFSDCTVCNRLVCYEKRKDGCATVTPNPNND